MTIPCNPSDLNTAAAMVELDTPKANAKQVQHFSALPAELLIAVASHLDGTSWAALAFASKPFLVQFAQSLDPQNEVRKRLASACSQRGHFCDTLHYRFTGQYRKRTPSVGHSDYNLRWILRQGPGFFLAFDAFTLLDAYRSKSGHTTNVITVNAGSDMASEVQRLLLHVAPAIQHRLCNRAVRFEFQVSWLRPLTSDEFTTVPRALQISRLQQNDAFAAANGGWRPFTMTHLFVGMKPNSDMLWSMVHYFGENDSGCGGLRFLSLTTRDKVRRSAVRQLMQVLEKYPTLETLSMDVGSSVSGLFTELMRVLELSASLKCLKIEFWRLHEQSRQRFEDVLSENTTLERLILHSEIPGRRMATSLVNALQRNTTLTNLTVDQRFLTTEGLEELMECMKNNTSITELSILTRQLVKDVAPIQSMLAENKTLRSLAVSEVHDSLLGGPTQADSIALLLGVLVDQTTLKQLDIYGFTLSRFCAQALLPLLERNDTLEVLRFIKTVSRLTSEDQAAIKCALGTKRTRTLKVFQWPHGDLRGCTSSSVQEYYEDSSFARQEDTDDENEERRPMAFEYDEGWSAERVESYDAKRYREQEYDGIDWDIDSDEESIVDSEGSMDDWEMYAGIY